MKTDLLFWIVVGWVGYAIVVRLFAPAAPV